MEISHRQVNKKLLPYKFSLTRIDNILDELGWANYFSCHDLMSGFHQIELEESSRHIKLFSMRLPFGLRIAPSSL